jgi:putative heme degradation protein
MNAPSALREALPQSPAEILPLLTGMGRVMLSARRQGAIHERMGPVRSVTIDADKARLTGECHDSVIDLAVVNRIVVDRSGTTRDKVLPKLECQDSAGETLFSLIGLEGIEPFDQALAPMGAGAPLEPVLREAPSGGAQDVAPEDPGAATFAAILANALPIAIDFERPGLFQHWVGLLPEPKPSMGFVNVMQGDFHLHLQAGAVASWAPHQMVAEVVLRALDAEGRETGLSLRGPAAAFAGVPGVREPAAHG